MTHDDSGPAKAALPRDPVSQGKADDEYCLGLRPTIDHESFPDEFRDVLEVRILGYRETGRMLQARWNDAFLLNAIAHMR